MRIVSIHASAADEAVAAAAWYERVRPGLGGEFEMALQAALDLLEAQVVPLASMPGECGDRGLKRLVLRRFPFDVIVVTQGDDFTVIAFAHHARRPGYWLERLRT